MRALGRFALAGALLLFLGSVEAAPAGAQERATPESGAEPSTRPGPVQPHPEAVKAIDRLKSPFCPGLMLEVCPSPQAAELRDTLQAMADRGVESDSLVAWALAQYGEEWRAVPQTEGKGLLAWIVPPLAILLGGGLVVIVLRRLRENDEGRIDDEAVRNLSDEEQRRISEALSEMEREGR